MSFFNLNKQGGYNYQYISISISKYQVEIWKYTAQVSLHAESWRLTVLTPEYPYFPRVC